MILGTSSINNHLLHCSLWLMLRAERVVHQTRCETPKCQSGTIDLANMQIFINALDGGIHRLDVVPETTVAQIKKSLGADEHILSYGSAILEDSLSLSSLDITDGASLAINARLLGGKVHGSLARAGKVRAQTPKVEKQEKKKKKKGRAARRIQYTRRFVNVATGPGKKRGPNSNAA
ncbi:hypothetical protein Y032_0106g3766 [Ancylostoma ceylanicum]|uniref:Ubiquitin-like domain-containing protein n=1 Tax=Ancylostoma ceylanicum TaxID=53326 RepID=A0A016TG78_9BILA|nr:hypothetical protein Y032_0106g3766 [Ancylostoma ceylanicum]